MEDGSSKAKTSPRHRWVRSLGLVLILGIVGLLACAWIAGSMLVHPANHAVAMPRGFSATSISIAGSGHAIAGWWGDKGENSPVVLLLHGARADRASMVPRAQLLQKHGFSVLLIDLQAHGETPGDAITFGARESADVTAALSWVRLRAAGRRVGVIGCSLGGAAVLLATQPSGFDAVVLEAVYPRIARAVENRVGLFVGPLAPALTPFLLQQMQPRLHLSALDLEPINSIGRLAAPVLIAAGSKDDHTTLAESQELYDAAANPKLLWVVEGAGHEDFLALDPRGYEDHVLEFLMENLRQPPPYETRRMGKSALEEWLANNAAAGKKSIFAPFQGVHRCCDRGDPELIFHADQRIEIYGDGFVPYSIWGSYEILADGKLVVSVNNAGNDPGSRRMTDLHNAYVYQYGPDYYLVQDSDERPDLYVKDKSSMWPFKSVAVQ